ncbi:MAG: DUF1800 domain-containing protein [Bacteriovorax sp.]|nr:DUF1800 domain-containing protein [Rhizobacter sp.]
MLAAVQCRADVPAAPAEWVDDLRPIAAADWNRERAAHLLERAGFGATPRDVQQSLALGSQAAVKALVGPQAGDDPAVGPFQPSGIPDAGIDPFPESRPLLTDTAKARGAALGVEVKPAGNRRLQPVVDKFFFWLRASALECNRIDYWWANRMLLTRRPLVEKMALFWHGHFATHEDKVRDHRKMLMQIELLQRRGLGNFRELMIAVAQDPAMLAFLDAGANVKGAPNENFAREILEMFTMGVGRYSEHDIRESARAFTGWNARGTRFVVDPERYDDGLKTVFGQEGRFDGVQVIDLILAQPATADYIAGRIYRFFVREDISPQTQRRLGAVLRENHYELAPLLETIFLSRDFYSAASVGTRIKSPVELLVSTYRKLGLRDVPGLPDFNDTTRALGQHLLHPPTVAGWAYGRAWITPGLLIERGNFVRDLMFPDFMAVSNDRYPLITVGAEVRSVHERISRGLDVTAATMPEASAATGAAMGDSGAMSESTRKLDREEDFNTRYASYRGWQKAVELIQPIPRTMARIDLSATVLASGAQNTGEVVDLFAQRFFSVPMARADRAMWTAFLSEQLGTERIEPARTYMEDSLRMLLHLMLSSPDYQLD